jgi:predicted Zn-dependent protease with MMP-like domain
VFGVLWPRKTISMTSKLTTREEAVAEIRETVTHELGHYFGLHDDDM